MKKNYKEAVKAILKYQEKKSELLPKLIPDDVKLTKQSLTKENVDDIRNNFERDYSASSANCLHCNIYQKENVDVYDACQKCEYVKQGYKACRNIDSLYHKTNTFLSDKEGAKLLKAGKKLSRRLRELL